MSTYSWQSTLFLTLSLGFFLGVFIGTSAAVKVLENRQDGRQAQIETEIAIARICVQPSSDDEERFCTANGF